MIKQMFKLVWNRKRTNLLIVAEVFFSFLVLFAVVSLGVYNVRNFRQPLGFHYDNVLLVSVDSIFQMSISGKLRSNDDIPRMLAALREMPQIEAAAGLGFPVFEIGSSTSDWEHKGRKVTACSNEATDAFDKVVKLEIVEGRWFNSSDDGAVIRPIVINRRLRNEIFPSEDPIGKTFQNPSNDKEQVRVIGVMTDFRQHGEAAGLENYYFDRLLAGPGQARHVMSLVMRLRPGTPASVQEEILSRLRSISHDRTYQIESMADKRRGYLKFQLAPLVAGSLIASFMMLMVALGMIGVVWQSVSRRAREIGLRRALGGTARDIWVQVLGELIVITTIGLMLGAALVVQVPMLQITDWLTGQVFAVSLAISLGLIYLLTIAAGMYPSWLATRVRPADVLHYE